MSVFIGASGPPLPVTGDNGGLGRVGGVGDIVTVPSGASTMLYSGGPLGTPLSGTLTNCTLPVGGISGLGAGVATLFAGASSGTGGPVGTTSPTLVTPTLGAAAATSITIASANGVAALVIPPGTTAPNYIRFTGTTGGDHGICFDPATPRGLGFILTNVSFGDFPPAFTFWDDNSGVGVIELKTGRFGRGIRFAPNGSGKVSVTSPFTLKGYTVATLPTGTQGDTAFVTDSLLPSFGATIAGGGAVVQEVFYNGTNWIAS